MSYYGVSPPSLISWLNPLDAINNVIQIVLYFFAMALWYLQELVNLLMSFAVGLFSGIVLDLASISEALGPLSLPVFVILFVSFLALLLLFISILRNLPIVGGFT